MLLFFFILSLSIIYTKIFNTKALFKVIQFFFFGWLAKMLSLIKSFLPNGSAHFIFYDAFKGSELVENVCDLYFFFYLLVSVYEYSLFLLSSEAPTKLQTESWTPDLNVSESNTTAIPSYFSLFTSLLTFYNCSGLPQRVRLSFFSFVCLRHHCAGQVHERTSVLEYGQEKGEQRHNRSKDTSHLAQVIEKAVNVAFVKESRLIHFICDCVPEQILIRNISYLSRFNIETFLYVCFEVSNAPRAINYFSLLPGDHTHMVLLFKAHRKKLKLIPLVNPIIAKFILNETPSVLKSQYIFELEPLFDFFITFALRNCRVASFKDNHQILSLNCIIVSIHIYLVFV